MSGLSPQPAGRDPRPVVRLPRRGLPGGLIVGVAAVLAILLFGVLDHRRRTAASHAAVHVGAVSAYPAPPPLDLPPESLSLAPDVAAPILPVEPPRTFQVQPPVYPQPRYLPTPPSLSIDPTATPTRAVAARPTGSAEPALILDTGAGEAVAATGKEGQAGGDGGTDAPVGVTLIRSRSTVIPSGTMIPAVLETPIDSARPGLVRAIVSEDVRGFDGSRVLVPRGSRLIGQYDADVRSGQNRVLVTWTRLIRPDGAAIRIGSPASDALGGGGVPGHVNTFFFQRFAGAVLQSALTVGVNLASRPGNGSVIVGLPTGTTGTIGQDLVPGSDLKPKIKVKQGAIVNVFVAHDLDFSGAPRVAGGAE